MSERAASKQLKKRWKNEGKGRGLREFATSLAKSEDAVAVMWFENKKGFCNQGRKPENIARSQLEATATSASRKKTGKK